MQRSILPRRIPVAQPLSFLYPPSCLDLAHSSTSSTATKQPTALRYKSSLAPTGAVAAAAAAAAQQLDPAHQDSSHHRQHHPDHVEPEFTFLRHHYNPPYPLLDHPPSNALLQQDANSHLEEERISQRPTYDPLTADDTPIPPTHRPKTSAAAIAELASLRQQSLNLRKAIQNGSEIDPATVIKRCRRLVLMSCRIQSRLRAGSAHAIVYETVADSALYLSASGQAISAATVLRHLLVKLGWNPRSMSELELSLPSVTGQNVDLSSKLDPALAAVASNAGARLALIAQQVISQLTLAPSPSSARPSRRFDSQQHLDAATSLVSAMHLAHMPRSTPSQTALIRAMIASGHTRLAVQTYAAEARAWWMAHREAKRPRSPTRRQAALVAEMGKPSSQALREVTSALQQIEGLFSRIQPDLLSERSDRERHALSAKRIEYAESLVDLIRLVRGGRLPLPPTPSAPEIAWILSACCRFESIVLLNEPVVLDSLEQSSSDKAERRRLVGAAEVVRYYLREYMQALPDGKTRSAGDLLIGGNPVVRPAVGVAVYNQLIHYALSVLKSPSSCKQVFQHMTQIRHPPLEPDAVTFNTILRQATTQRYELLARAVLTTKQAGRSQTSASSGQPTSNVASPASTPSAIPATEVEARPLRPMIDQIDTAIAQADSYRLVSLLQYVTASGLFLRRFRHEPGHAGVKEIVMRIYPALDAHRYARRPAPSDVSDGQQLASSSASDRRLRPKANQASRHAILDPHVLTATLNLAVKAGKTGLALRLWRLIKRTSLQSVLQSPSIDVAKAPWKVPVEAATLLMQALANEAARAPTVRHALRSQHTRLSSRMVPRRRSAASASRHREYARGWNIMASLRGQSFVGGSYSSAGELGEGLRWRAAQLLAKREYVFLIHHWGLTRKLGRWRRKRVVAWLEPAEREVQDAAPTVRSELGEDGDVAGPKPDSRFYDAVLGVFGRRPGMIQRSGNHISRSEVLAQLRRGYKDAATKAGVLQASSTKEEAVVSTKEELASSQFAATSPDQASMLDRQDADQTSDLSTLTTSHLLSLVVSRVHWNSRGRSTAHPPDPFLLRILLDMEALDLTIPVGFRWILTHCALHCTAAKSVPELLQNETSVVGRGRKGAFSAWRGPRIKTKGMIARRPNKARIRAQEEEKGGSTK